MSLRGRKRLGRDDADRMAACEALSTLGAARDEWLREWPMREIMNAIFHVPRAGCPWCMPPKDFPPTATVCGWFLR